MTSDGFRFDRFLLDTGDRRLMADGVPVELNARYFDALVLLVREAGKLVSKDRFLDEVWRGVPVTDEALTQSIRTLRRQLGDDAGRPRFIETVPKHGYRFIAPVEPIDGTSRAIGPSSSGHPWRPMVLLGGAGTLGAGLAGAVGGLFYGFVGASQPFAPGVGAASVLLVLLWLTVAAALMGGAGVSLGMAAGALGRDSRWTIVGGALGGLIVGGVVKLLGLDAFNLLLGRSPGDITGGAEGVVLGGAAGLAMWFAGRRRGTGSTRRAAVIGASIGALSGMLITATGGRLMGGSLDLLARSFPDSRLRFDVLSGLFGEDGFGPVTRIVTGALEGALFVGCVVGAMHLARRSLDERISLASPRRSAVPSAVP